MSTDGKTKLCTGPGHDEPTWLPATDKYFHRHKTGERKGKLHARCRLCVNWTRLKSPGISGYVPAARVRPFFIEGVNKVGMMEFCRRAEMSQTTVRNIIVGKVRNVQKRTARRAMLQVISIRRKDEVRHRDSIAVGAHLRGWREKKVVDRKDLYRPHGDDMAESRRAYRNEHVEKERAMDRERRRRKRTSLTL